MLVVVAEDERTDPEGRRVGGGDRHRRQRRELRPDEVVGQVQRRVAEVLDLAGLVAPVGIGLGARHLHPEPERLRHRILLARRPGP